MNPVTGGSPDLPTDRDRELRLWKATVSNASTDAAFFAGYLAAKNPTPKNHAELIAEIMPWVIKQHEEKAARIAALPPGTCLDCEGEGWWGSVESQRGGECESCNGTGKAPPANKCSRPKCNGDMKPSKAIQETYTGMPDFPGAHVVTVSAGGPGRLVDCLKCSMCGWSISA